MTDNAVVFADVHGQLKHLQKLIKIIRDRFGNDVEIYSTGDLIDRGPDSKGVIQLCIDEGIHAQIGNHEQWLQNLITREFFQAYALEAIMGGSNTVESYDVDLYSDGTNIVYKDEEAIALELLDKIPQEHKDWIAALPKFRKLEVGDEIYWLTHAGVRSSVYQQWKYNKSGKKALPDNAVIKRIAEHSHGNDILWPSPFLGGHGRPDNLAAFEHGIQIFGHRPVRSPVIKGHFIALDTGCGTCNPWTLSAIVLPTHEIIQVTVDEEWV
jgi:hypothetical protein